MAHYVLSDIHGEEDRFHAMLEKICFTPGYRVFMLGYSIDVS